ncbi:hypothetical protein, partial [Caldisphaera sp.]|uniref:hypothetical protein n=1 Tax=Caldisphaera sp. TaxID=2060322 RepID=UPI003D0CEA51
QILGTQEYVARVWGHYTHMVCPLWASPHTLLFSQYFDEFQSLKALFKSFTLPLEGARLVVHFVTMLLNTI